MAGRGKLALRRRAKRRLVARVPGSGVLAIVRAGSDMGVTGRYRQRALSALKWSVSGDVAEQVIRAGYAIVLARLLSPREFGLVAMVTVITQFVISIADLGFEEALVQWPDVSEAHRSSVFWLTLVVGAGLAVALFAGAQSIAAFYGVQEVAPLAALLSALFVLTAAGTVPRAIVTRQLDFQSVAWLQCVTAVLACTCAVTLAWRGFGALSLAADLLLTEALETLLYFAASAWRPRLACRFAALRELFSFSGYRVAGRTVTFSTQLDRLLIGKFLGSGALGLYGRAYNLTRIPLLYATRSISKVMFPSLVQIQGDVHRVGDVYLRTVGGVALLTFPMCMGLFAAAEPLIVGILGPQWREAVPILRILALSVVVQSLTLLANTVCLSQGRADLQLRLTVLQRASTIVAIVPCLRWGVRGVAIAYSLATALSAWPTLSLAGRLVGLRTSAVLARAWPVFVASTAMAATVLAVDAWGAAHLQHLQVLVLDVGTGVPAYWLAVWLLRVPAYHDVLGVLRPRPAKEGGL